MFFAGASYNLQYRAWTKFNPIILFKNEEFINKHSLDLPDVVKILKELVIKLGLESTDINIYQDDLKSAYNELERVIGHE